MATRKTHVVRIGVGPPPQVTYVDMEVLDAVSFRRENGDEVVLHIKVDTAVPYITDDTGDGNQKQPSALDATSRSHMKQIKGSPDDTEVMDVEILDAISFQGTNGEAWVMVCPDKGSLSVYNTTTHEGDITSTRRVHDELLYSDPTDKTSPSITVTRCDTMCFRSTNNEEVIIVMPSSDDGIDPGALENYGSAQRADTIMDPAGYDPASTNVIPPPNTDPRIYAFFPTTSKGAPTGGTDTTKNPKIECGPLWWPRAISQKVGPWYWYIPVQTASTFSLYVTPGRYQWVTNPSDSSWAGVNATMTWEWLQGILYQSLDYSQVYFIPFQPFGWASIDDAIKSGIQDLDWGYLDLSDTRIDDNQKNGLNATPCVPGVSGYPDIWQLTKIKAPDLIKPVPPAIKWAPGPITAALYKKVAVAIAKAWNDTSTGFNGEMAACAITVTPAYWYITWPAGVDNGDTQRFGMGNYAVCMSFPSTAFGVPLWDETNIFAPITAGRFVGGLPYPYYNIGNSDVFTWAGVSVPIDPPGAITGLWGGSYASMIATSQLDPKKWDTSDPKSPKPKKS